MIVVARLDGQAIVWRPDKDDEDKPTGSLVFLRPDGVEEDLELSCATLEEALDSLKLAYEDTNHWNLELVDERLLNCALRLLTKNTADGTEVTE